MKTIKFSLLLLFLASPIFIFSNFRPVAGTINATVHAESSLTRVRVELAKPSGMPISVRVLDQNGWPLHEQTLAGSPTQATVSLNMCALPDGLYRLDVAGGRSLQSYEIKLASVKNAMSDRQVDVKLIDN